MLHPVSTDRGAALGFDFDEIVSVVMALAPADFYKSMTTHADHKVWLDVYRRKTQAGELYLKAVSVSRDVAAYLKVGCSGI